MLRNWITRWRLWREDRRHQKAIDAWHQFGEAIERHIKNLSKEWREGE